MQTQLFLASYRTAVSAGNGPFCNKINRYQSQKIIVILLGYIKYTLFIL